jgi:hypothetical protein
MKNNHNVLVVFSAFVCIVGLVCGTARLTQAKGNFAKIVITSDRLTSEIEVTDPSLLSFFSFSDFPNARATEPSFNEGYVVTRYFLDESGTLHAFDRLRYYPNHVGPGGFIFYEGLINGGSEYDGKWYAASSEGDAAMRRNIGNTESVRKWPRNSSKCLYYSF